jgi:hypothetical protein
MIDMIWIGRHPDFRPDMLGFLPLMFSAADPRSAREQVDDNYAHGGGFRAFHGFTMLPNGDLSYPGDPPARLLAETKLRDETIRLFEHAWVAIIQPDGTWEVCRMD